MRDIEFECKYQADFFELSTNKKDCSSVVFIKQFSNSKLAKAMDNRSYLFLADDITKAYDSLKKEKKLTLGKEIYPKKVMSWIGYIMRYMAIKYEYTTKNVYSIIKPKELYGMYEAYHSLDNDLVCERILEAKNINLNLNNIEIFKKIYLN